MHERIPKPTSTFNHTQSDSNDSKGFFAPRPWGDIKPNSVRNKSSESKAVQLQRAKKSRQDILAKLIANSQPNETIQKLQSPKNLDKEPETKTTTTETEAEAETDLPQQIQWIENIIITVFSGPLGFDEAKSFLNDLKTSPSQAREKLASLMPLIEQKLPSLVVVQIHQWLEPLIEFYLAESNQNQTATTSANKPQNIKAEPNQPQLDNASKLIPRTNPLNNASKLIPRTNQLNNASKLTPRTNQLDNPNKLIPRTNQLDNPNKLTPLTNQLDNPNKFTAENTRSATKDPATNSRADLNIPTSPPSLEGQKIGTWRWQTNPSNKQKRTETTELIGGGQIAPSQTSGFEDPQVAAAIATAAVASNDATGAIIVKTEAGYYPYFLNTSSDKAFTRAEVEDRLDNIKINNLETDGKIILLVTADGFIINVSAGAVDLVAPKYPPNSNQKNTQSTELIEESALSNAASLLAELEKDGQLNDRGYVALFKNLLIAQSLSRLEANKQLIEEAKAKYNSNNSQTNDTVTRLREMVKVDLALAERQKRLNELFERQSYHISNLEQNYKLYQEDGKLDSRPARFTISLLEKVNNHRSAAREKLEDIKRARATILAEYPATGVLENRDVSPLQSNSQVIKRLNSGFDSVIVDIEKIKIGILNGDVPISELKPVVNDVKTTLVAAGGEKAVAAIAKEIEAELARQNNISLGAFAAGVGLTVATLLSGGIVPAILGATGAALGIGTAVYELERADDLKRVADTGKAGGNQLLDDPGAANYNYTMAWANLVLAGVDVFLSVKELKDLPQNTRLPQTLKQSDALAASSGGAAISRFYPYQVLKIEEILDLRDKGQTARAEVKFSQLTTNVGRDGRILGKADVTKAIDGISNPEMGASRTANIPSATTTKTSNTDTAKNPDAETIKENPNTSRSTQGQTDSNILASREYTDIKGETHTIKLRSDSTLLRCSLCQELIPDFNKKLIELLNHPLSSVREEAEKLRQNSYKLQQRLDAAKESDLVKNAKESDEILAEAIELETQLSQLNSHLNYQSGEVNLNELRSQFGDDVVNDLMLNYGLIRIKALQRLVNDISSEDLLGLINKIGADKLTEIVSSRGSSPIIEVLGLAEEIAKNNKAQKIDIATTLSLELSKTGGLKSKSVMGIYRELNKQRKLQIIESSKKVEKAQSRLENNLRKYKQLLEKRDYLRQRLTPTEKQELEKLKARLPKNEKILNELENNLRDARQKDINTHEELEQIAQRLNPEIWAELPCFAPETLVWTVEGAKSIKETQAGELVLTFDFEQNQVVKQKILRVIKNKTLHFYEIRIGSSMIKATGNHPFWIEDRAEWIVARNLEKGMNLKHFSDKKIEIDSITLKEGFESETYNLSIDKNPNYFVSSGILVHNSGRIDYGMGSYILYLGTNKKYSDKVYVGITNNRQEREERHRYDAKIKLQDLENTEKQRLLTSKELAEKEFQLFKQDIVLKERAVGIKDFDMARYLEQKLVDYLKETDTRIVINKDQAQITPEKLKEWAEEMREDPLLIKQGYCA